MAFNSTPASDYDCLNNEASPTVKLRFSLPITVFVYCVYAVPFCFGVFGNISVCLIFFQQKKLRSITNTFLMNLCKYRSLPMTITHRVLDHAGLNDLIVLCLSTPMTLSTVLFDHWVFGEFLCRFVHFIPTMTALISTFTVAIIAVERWFFIVKKKKFDRCCTLITLMLVWAISIVIALPEFVSRYVASVTRPVLVPMLDTVSSSNPTVESPADCRMEIIHYCLFLESLRPNLFSKTVITVQYLMPFLFVSVSCYSVSRFLKRRMKHMCAYQMPRPTKPNRAQRSSEPKRPSRTSLHDDTTEHELTSYEEVPVTFVPNEHRMTPLLMRFRDSMRNRNFFQNSVVLNNHGSPSSSIVGTVLMPTAKSQSHSKRRFHRSRKLLICVAALFTMSWLPLTVVQLYLDHNATITLDEPNFVYGCLLIPCYLISSLSAWMNPVIYNYINRSFRREFYALYPCCGRLSSSRSSAAALSRTDMPSSIVRNPHRQGLMSIPEDPSSRLAPSSNRSSTRYVSFAEQRRTNGSTPLVLINENV